MSFSLDPSIGRPAPRHRCEWCGDLMPFDTFICDECTADHDADDTDIDRADRELDQ